MHESGIVRSLVARADSAVEEAGVAGADRIGIRIGALSGIDPEVVRTQWRRFATASTRDAELILVVDDDQGSVGALGATLDYIEVAG